MKNYQRNIIIYRANGTPVDVTDYVIACTVNQGDVSGIGDQGNDGVSPILDITLKHDTENGINFNPGVITGLWKSIKVTKTGNGISRNFTPIGSNIYPDSIKTFSTSNPDFFTDWTLTSTGLLRSNELIPNGTEVTLFYSYFDQTADNEINKPVGIEDSLIQSNRIIDVIVRKGNVISHKQTITGDGTNRYTIDISLGTGTLIKDSVFTYDWSNSFIGGWYIDYGTNELVCSSNIPIGEIITVLYSYNDGSPVTLFRGLIGDSISPGKTSISLQVRELNTKILQDTPIIKEKLRGYKDGGIAYVNGSSSFEIPYRIIDYSDTQIGSLSSTPINEPYSVENTYYTAEFKYRSVSFNGSNTITGSGINVGFSVNDYIALVSNGTIFGSGVITNISTNTITVSMTESVGSGVYDLHYVWVQGIPVKDYLQQIIDDTIGINIVNLYQTEDPGYNVLPTEKMLEYKTLHNLCTDRVNEFGWGVLPRYNNPSEPFRMTIIKPERDKTIADHTRNYLTDFYKQDLKISDQSLRDGVIVYYNSEETGEKEYVTSPLGTDLVDMQRPLILEEEYTEGINFESEAQDYADSVYEDVKDIPIVSQITSELEPDLQVFDLEEIFYPFLSSTDNKYATQSIQHDIMSLQTTRSGTVRVRGGLNKWRRIEAKAGAFRPSTSGKMTTGSIFPPISNLTAEERIENKGQTISKTVLVSWDKPIGYFPSNYQIEIKKSTDVNWDDSEIFIFKNNSCKLSVEDGIIYNIRVAGRDKNGDLGFYSEIVTIEITNVALQSDGSKILYIRNQEQFSEWVNEVSKLLADTSYITPEYDEVRIYNNSIGYVYNFETTRIRIEKTSFKIIGIGNPDITINTNYSSLQAAPIIINADNLYLNEILFSFDYTGTSPIYCFYLENLTTSKGTIDIKTNIVSEISIFNLFGFRNKNINLTKSILQTNGNYCVRLDSITDDSTIKIDGNILSSLNAITLGVSSTFKNVKIINNTFINSRVEILDDCLSSTISNNTWNLDENMSLNEVISVSDLFLNNTITDNRINLNETTAGTLTYYMVDSSLGSFTYNIVTGNTAYGNRTSWFTGFVSNPASGNIIDNNTNN